MCILGRTIAKVRWSAVYLGSAVVLGPVVVPGVLQEQRARACRVQFQIVRPDADLASAVLGLGSSVVRHWQAAVTACVALLQSPEARNQRGHQRRRAIDVSVTCQFAVHAQETGLAAEKPQVCQTGLQPGRQMAVFLSGYPAKVHFRLS
ncbi:MAG: hypothetical protein V7703_10440, partial [Hyphomicrobiales bacterium]